MNFVSSLYSFNDHCGWLFFFACPLNLLPQQLALTRTDTMLSVPKSCCSAGSQTPLITCYSPGTPSEFLVFWELLRHEFFNNMFGCWVQSCGVLEPACKPIVHMSYQLCVQEHQVGILKSSEAWVFTPQKSVNTTSQIFLPYGKPVVKHLLTWAGTSAWLCQVK